jgi:thiol-disulfide isomerase/thioredoxin
MTPRPAGVLGVLLAMLLAGCSAIVPTTSPTPGTDLVAARRAAGIQDCPQPVGEAVTGGMPELTLDCLGGDATVSLAALRGPMLINLWAQWCLPCRQEAPVLAAFDAARDDVGVLGINYDDPEPDWAIEFARLSGWTWPQLADPDKTIQAPVGVPGIPVTLLLDAEGRIVTRHSGAFTDLDELSAWVDEGLKA